MRAARTARDPRFVAATVILVACALISGMSLGSDSTSAATGPLGIRGYVWDQNWDPVPNANVTVKSFDGPNLVRTVYYDATEIDGYYAVTFTYYEWNPGYRIEITAVYGIYSATNDTVAVEQIDLPYQWLNVSLADFVIPEFGSGVTVALTIVGVAAMVIVMKSRRRRRA